MPNKNTFEIKPIYDFILHNFDTRYGITLDPFSNGKLITKVTNDLNQNVKADYHLEALDFLKKFDDSSITGILFDPPYSPRQIKECYNNIGIDNFKTDSSFYSELKDEISRVMKPCGVVISFGWNSNGIGKSRGFFIERILIVAHGGNHNDTICTKEIRMAL